MPLNFHDNDWLFLEKAARNAVMAGGYSAMTYYNQVLAESTDLEKVKNPTTDVDIQATLAILRFLDPYLRQFSGTRGFGRSYFAEELESQKNDAREKAIQGMLFDIGNINKYVKRSKRDFIESFDNCISVLFDGLDGTTNFTAGIPFFCSAVAFFLKGIPRTGAIYDPVNNCTYFGSIREKGILDLNVNKAVIWLHSNGVLIPMQKFVSQEKPMIGLHLTRSNPLKLDAFLNVLPGFLNKFSSTYMLNSGELALAYVANGSLSAFVNNYTKIWDVAAGAVLIECMGGKVTDFQGNNLDYTVDRDRIEVVAAIDEVTHGKIIEILKDYKSVEEPS